MDELIRELEELAELAASASGDEAETTAIRNTYAHAAVLAHQAKRRMADREFAWDVQS